MQLENVKKLLETSPQVTSVEREEWLSLLQFMNDKQLLELTEILESPVNMPATVPVAEVAKSENAQVVNSSNSISEVLKRNMPPVSAHQSSPFSTDAVKTLPKAILPDTPKPEPAVKLPPVVLQPELKPAQNPSQAGKASVAATKAHGPATGVVQRVTMPEEIMPEAKSLEDVGRLNVATLRGRGAVTVEAELTALCKKFGYFSVLLALEQSPLYKTYLTSGNSALQEHVSFEQAETKLSVMGQPYLTKPEFEEVNDLLQRLKHI